MKRKKDIDDIINFLDPDEFKNIAKNLSHADDDIRNQLQEVAKELDELQNDLLLIKELKNHWETLLQILQKSLGFSLLKQNAWKSLFKDIFHGIVAPFWPLMKILNLKITGMTCGNSKQILHEFEILHENFTEIISVHLDRPFGKVRIIFHANVEQFDEKKEQILLHINSSSISRKLYVTVDSGAIFHPLFQINY